jgi:hypothetical protein
MGARPDTDLTGLRLLDIGLRELAAHPGLLQAMFDQRLDGVLVRGVFSRSAMRTVCQRLDDDAVPKRVMADQAHLPNPPYTVGQAIVGAPDSLDDYFADAAEQAARLRGLFEGLPDFASRVAELLSQLAGGLPVRVAEGPDGQACPSATIRVLPHGAEIGVHVDNAFLHMSRAHHLHRLVDTRDQLSYLVPLSTPQAGGQLLVHALQWDAARLFMPGAAGQAGYVWLEGSEVFDLIGQLPATVLAPEVGDLLVFDGGRHFHRVSKVVGAVPRRTIGGFCALSREHDRVVVWS